MNLLILVACFLTAFIVRAIVNWIDLVPWRKSAAAHWTERSRILWPVRKTDVILLLYVPLLLAIASTFLGATSTSQLFMRWAAAFIGTCGAGWYLTRQVYPNIHFRHWLHDVSINWILQFGMWSIYAAVGYTMPQEFNNRTWLTLGGMVLFQVAWPSLALALLRLLGVLKPPSARLRKIVADCDQTDSPLVKNLWQARGIVANALALPLSGTLIFYDRLLEILTDEEVAAVCCHELGHLAESNCAVLARYVGSLAILPLLLLKPAFYQWEFLGFIGMLLVMIVWSRLARKLVHRMELRADSTASQRTAGEGVYARALENVYRANQMPAVMPGNASTHPHLYDRMLAAGITPEYPRPRGPSRFTFLGWLVLIACPSGLVSIYLATAPFAPPSSTSKETRIKTSE